MATRELNLHIDYDRPGGLSCLLDGKKSSSFPGTLSLIQADKFKLNLFFRRRGTSTGEDSSAITLAGTSIKLGAKKTKNMQAAGNLFNIQNFVEAGEDDDLHYEGTLDLNTGNLITAMGDETSIAVSIDVELQSAGNTERISYRINCVVIRQAYAGEGDPDPGTPIYPAPEDIVTKIRGTVEIDNGVDEVEVSGLALTAVPAQVLLTMRKPTAGSGNITAVAIDESISKDGFIASLTAQTEEEGYKLDYLIILP